MENIEIIEKDGKKYIDGEEILLEIEYNPFGKIFALGFRVFGLLLGLFFFLAFQNYIAKTVSMFVILFSILDFMGILLFNKLIFTNNRIMKYSHCFFRKKSFYLKYEELETTVSKRYFGGTLMFWKKHQRFKTIWHFKFDLFPISNEEFKQIREILINKKIIEGDTNGWAY